MGTPENITLPDFQVFVKPAGAECNLHCAYCYYIGRSGSGSSVMSYEILERVVKQQIETAESSAITFSWHGGEPLLAGIDFFRSAVTLQKKYCPPGKRIINGIQTNGTLINEEWCRFFDRENFIVGLSMDGPEKYHDRFRRGRDGEGSFAKVLNGFDLLVMHGIDPEILCVVNSVNSPYPLEVYDFFRQLGVTHLTFIPLVERTIDGAISSMSVSPAAWGRFLIDVFDEWVEHDIGNIKVQIFEETLKTAFRHDHDLCIFKRECGRVPVIEHNGDFYSCDHYVRTDYKIGNIGSSTLQDLLQNESQVAFGKGKSDTLPVYCRNCEVLELCNGECPKNRFIKTPGGEEGLNYLCEGYRGFFNHCRPVISSVGKLVIPPVYP